MDKNWGGGQCKGKNVGCSQEGRGGGASTISFGLGKCLNGRNFLIPYNSQGNPRILEDIFEISQNTHKRNKVFRKMNLKETGKKQGTGA